MAVDVQALRLDGFSSLPDHARSCVFWELDPETGTVHDSAFEKEAWASMVLLEWGKCAQIAVDDSGDGLEFDPDAFPLCGKAVAVAFYAPPSRVPGAARFPTGPVSADAILLTSIVGPGVRPAESASEGDPGIVQQLISAVVTDLVRRGVRAIEAFGRELDQASNDDGMCRQCIIEARALRDAGFDEVAPHEEYPRFRLELDEGLGWKAEVESALERLFVVAALDVTPQRQPAGVSNHHH